MRVVERNKIGKRAHVCVRKRLQIVRDLRPEFVEQRGELVAGVSEYVASVSIHNRRAKTRHHIERVIGECDRLFIARNATAKVAVIEKAGIASDSPTVQRAALKKWRVISLRRF